jgi:2-polyprenyl-3-methyl-5-hydroxy-6-metoxy-1,4-benzoquinol methylase
VERLTLETAREDTMLAVEHRQRYEFAARLLGDSRVVDLCCGSGYGAELLALTASRVLGVDNDVATVETARATVAARCAGVAFEAADAVQFLRRSLRDEFDALVCFEGLEHLADLDGAVALLRHHAELGLRLVVSVPNDKLTGVHNPFHLTRFGYEEAVATFGAFPRVVMVPQFLAEGSIIAPPGASAAEAAAEVSLLDRCEPAYANHFIFCVGFAAEEIQLVIGAKLQVNASPLFNRWSENLKLEAAALRRENARLARAKLGKGAAAAAAALAAVQRREARIAELEASCRAAEQRLAELGAAAAPERTAGQPAEPVPRTVVGAVPARPVEVPGEVDPNSWEHRRARAAQFLIPWLEQTVPLRGTVVLEYGCGNGPVTSAFAERAQRVIGLDIDATWLAEARERLAARGLDNVELALHPPERIVAAAAAYAGQVDVFLLYAVLEHLTVSERLQVLRLAREVTKPDGVIVVCETPNRLTYFDHHTGQIPFLHLLPAELALEYHTRSPREDFTSAIATALGEGHRAGLEKLARWGRGVSFHDFEVVFGDLARHVLASNYDPLLFGERPVHPEETILARYLHRLRPDLAPVWSRAWLDLILSPQPVARRGPFLRPWPAETVQSRCVGLTVQEELLFAGPGSTLHVELPSPTELIVIGSLTADGHAVSLWVRPEGDGGTALIHHHAPPGMQAFASVEFARPCRRFQLEASAACRLVFVGYRD